MQPAAPAAAPTRQEAAPAATVSAAPAATVAAAPAATVAAAPAATVAAALAAAVVPPWRAKQDWPSKEEAKAEFSTKHDLEQPKQEAAKEETAKVEEELTDCSLDSLPKGSN